MVRYNEQKLSSPVRPRSRGRSTLYRYLVGEDLDNFDTKNKATMTKDLLLRTKQEEEELNTIILSIHMYPSKHLEIASWTKFF